MNSLKRSTYKVGDKLTLLPSFFEGQFECANGADFFDDEVVTIEGFSKFGGLDVNGGRYIHSMEFKHLKHVG